MKNLLNTSHDVEDPLLQNSIRWEPLVEVQQEWLECTYSLSSLLDVYNAITSGSSLPSKDLLELFP